jgi:hypothetical protein
VLRGNEADLARALAARAHTPPDAAALAGLADDLDEMLATARPEQEVLRLLIKEIRVQNRRRIVPTSRVPAAVRAMPSKVELAGLEPATSWVRSRRSLARIRLDQRLSEHAVCSPTNTLRPVFP